VYGDVERQFSGQSRQDLVSPSSLHVHLPASDHVGYLHHVLLESWGLTTLYCRFTNISALPDFCSQLSCIQKANLSAFTHSQKRAAEAQRLLIFMNDSVGITALQQVDVTCQPCRGTTLQYATCAEPSHSAQALSSIKLSTPGGCLKARTAFLLE